MASSVTEKEVDDISETIDAAFNVWDTCKVDAGTNESKRNVISFQAMHDAYIRTSNKSDIKEPDTMNDAFDIVNDLMLPCVESKFLTDEKLVEALIYSKTYHEESEFEKSRHQHEGELLWVGKDGDFFYLVHVSQNRIIYKITKVALDLIRSIGQKLWPLLKEKVRNNLLDFLSTSEPVPDWSKYAASLQSSFDAAACGNFTCEGHLVRYPLTDDVKEVILDEVKRLNLDPRIKEQFVFDMKVLPHKDLLYWRDRVDRLRFISSCVAVITPEQAVANHETSVQVRGDKADEKLQQLVENISNLQETVNRNELSLVKRVEEKMDEGFSSAIREELQRLSQIMTGVESNLEQIRLCLQECNSGVEKSSKRLEALSAIPKIDSSLSSVEDQVKKLDGIVNPIHLTVEKLAVEVQQNATLLKRLATKKNVSTTSPPKRVSSKLTYYGGMRSLADDVW